MAIEYIEIDEQATILIEMVAPSASTVIEVSGGAKGERGESGSVGSLPPGGTVGQTLIKQSSTDADAEWTTLTKASVGLALVNNTSDENKPISALQQEALDEKANAVHSHAITNITGLQGALDAKSDDGHEHTASEISNSTTIGRSLITAASATDARNAIGAGIGNVVGVDVNTILKMTRAEFDALATKDASTMYLIRG